MLSEKQRVKMLFERLCEQPQQRFPQPYEQLEAPEELGIYVIRKKDRVACWKDSTCEVRNLPTSL